MVMIKCKKGKERFFLTKETYIMCQRIKRKILEDDSMVYGFLFGTPGCGKSLLAQRLALAVDPTFEGRIPAVAFDKDEFVNAILNSKQQAIVGDEGIALFNRRAVMTKEGRLLGALIDQIRQKNLFVLICVPKLTTIDKNVLEEANFVGYVWESRKREGDKTKTIKGNVAFYPKLTGDNYAGRLIKWLEDRKRGKKTSSKPSPAFTMQGNPVSDDIWYPSGKTSYLKKKNAILESYRPQQVRKNEKKELILMMKKNCPELTDGMIAKALGLTREWVNTLKNEDMKLKKGNNVVFNSEVTEITTEEPEDIKKAIEVLRNGKENEV